MLDHEIVAKVDRPDHPQRCQAVVPTGQCMNMGVAPGKNCLAHGGAKTIKAEEAKSIYKFRIHKYQQRVGEIARSASIKSLREEIGVLRMLLEEKMNACTMDNDLILNSGDISDLVLKIDKLVNSCNAIELKLSVLIDRQTLIAMVDQIVQVLSTSIEDKLLLDKIAVQIMEVVEGTVVTDGKGRITESNA